MIVLSTYTLSRTTLSSNLDWSEVFSQLVSEIITFKYTFVGSYLRGSTKRLQCNYKHLSKRCQRLILGLSRFDEV